MTFLHHFLEMHWLIDIYIQEEELYLQDKICAYAHKDTRKALTIWTWQECEDARENNYYSWYVIREATQSEKDFYDTRSI